MDYLTKHWRLGLGLAALGALALALFSCRSLDWFLLKRSLRRRFTGEKWITTQALADWLVDGKRPPPVLLDVRTPAEWEVSHLAGARRVEPEASAKEAGAGLGKDEPIVTYCSVGFRSGKMAERLRQAGFTNVRNLEGSIFQWANEHRPLVRGGERVVRVHPYNAVWGLLLRREVRAAPPGR